MFGKEKRSEPPQSDWANRFEANHWAADELAFARLLHDSRPELAHMPLAARQRLRLRIIGQHSQQKNQQYNPIHSAVRYAIITTAVAMVAGLL